MDGVHAQILSPEPFHLSMKMLINAGKRESGCDELGCIIPVDMSEADDDQIETRERLAYVILVSRKCPCHFSSFGHKAIPNV